MKHPPRGGPRDDPPEGRAAPRGDTQSTEDLVIFRSVNPNPAEELRRFQVLEMNRIYGGGR